MKYIDGIKDSKEFDQHLYFQDSYSRNCYGWKSIPITYYKPLRVPFKRVWEIGWNHIDDPLVLDNLKWIDGQPYELVTLNKGVKSL